MEGQLRADVQTSLDSRRKTVKRTKKVYKKVKKKKRMGLEEYELHMELKDIETQIIEKSDNKQKSIAQLKRARQTFS